LLALVLGVFGAVYFQGNGPGAPPQVANNESAPSAAPASNPATPETQPPQAAAPSENKPQEQAAVPPESNPLLTTEPAPQTAQAPTAPPLPAVPQQDQNQPQIQASNTSPSLDDEAQRLAQIAPTAAPADVAAATPRYWVEFGAYDTARYADDLKQSLGRLGIDATIAKAPGKDGRTYLRVRTASDSDRATAAAQLAKAQSSLHIAPLLHRVAAINPAPTRALEAQTKPVSSGGYWVQFGAFRDHRNAETMRSQLRRKDIQATVFERKNSDLKPLYLVRVSGLSTYAQASRTAQRGGSATHTSDAFVGQDRQSASRPSPGLNRRAPTR
jgi:cell division protein FtsN